MEDPSSATGRLLDYIEGSQGQEGADQEVRLEQGQAEDDQGPLGLGQT